MCRSLLVAVAVVMVSGPASAAENLIQGGDFERGTEGWSPLWSRDPVGKAFVDQKNVHGGRQAIRIEHAGARDWSLNQNRWINVTPGQIFELNGWVRVTGDGDSTLCVTLSDHKDAVLEWSFAPRTAKAADGWTHLRSRFVVPAGAARLQTRLIGNGRATVWFDDARLELAGSLKDLKHGPLPDSLGLSNASLDEGMLSLGPYRIDDAGRDIARVLAKAPERVAKFQTGHVYRLPLWELVYHDCVIAHWYWGDYNNKITSLWDRRDLWNALYGTAPMLMFDLRQWETHRDRFVQTYRATAAVARATGYAEMTNHRRLTPDHAIQQSTFANGVTVTVNFGDRPYMVADGATVPPLGKHVMGLR